MTKSNEQLLRELQKRRYDPCTLVEAEQGLYFADTVQKIALVLLEKIKEMEADLRKQGVTVDAYFDEQGKALELQKSMQAYKHSLLTIDSIITKEFADSINQLPEGIATKGIDLQGALIQLSNARTQVYLMQNKLLQFFFMRTNVLCCGRRTVQEFMVNQSSRIVFAGDKLEITAGLVTVEWQAEPSVSINNKQLDASSGKAVYQMKVPDISREYAVPVRVQYRSQQTGQFITTTRKVHYTVIKKVDSL